MAPHEGREGESTGALLWFVVEILSLMAISIGWCYWIFDMDYFKISHPQLMLNFDKGCDDIMSEAARRVITRDPCYSHPSPWPSPTSHVTACPVACGVAWTADGGWHG